MKNIMIGYNATLPLKRKRFTIEKIYYSTTSHKFMNAPPERTKEIECRLTSIKLLEKFLLETEEQIISH